MQNSVYPYYIYGMLRYSKLPGLGFVLVFFLFLAFLCLMLPVHSMTIHNPLCLVSNYDTHQARRYQVGTHDVSTIGHQWQHCPLKYDVRIGQMCLMFVLYFFRFIYTLKRLKCTCIWRFQVWSQLCAWLGCLIKK